MRARDLQRPVAVALAIALVGCGAGAHRVRKAGDERLAAIRIEGNHAIDRDTLVHGLELHHDQAAELAVDTSSLVTDTARIRTAYLERGYFAVDVQARIEPRGRDDADQIAIFTVIEGPRATTVLAISGLPPEVSEAAVRKVLPLADGAPFDYETYDLAKPALVALLEDAGYAHGRVDADVVADRARARATVRLAFVPGARCRFGAIEITGADGALARAIRARLAFRPGDRYSAEALAESERAIFELGRFSSVRLEPDRRGADVIPVQIAVARASRHAVELGGGIGYEPLTWDLRLRAGFSWVDPIPLTSINVDARPALTFPHNGPLAPDLGAPEWKLRASLTLQRIDLLRPGLRAEIQPGFDYVTVEAYTYQGPRLRVGLSSPLGVRWLQLALGWQLQRYKFSGYEAIDAATQVALGLDKPELLGAYQQALVADLRDNPLMPTRGVYLELRASEGTRYAGGAFDYLQLTPDVRGYVPLGPLVLALRARLGVILGKVPVTERYYAGGAASQRGFSERHLSPTNMGIPIGGAGVIETGAELRAPLPWKFFGLPMGGVLFLDGGDVTATAAALDPRHLHWAVGAGLRIEVIKSVTFRLDTGYRLNRTGPDEPQPETGWDAHIAVHLGVGQAY
ncbi:MAG: BamA/TamA family outer membrane protein [Deltaproteobacteria bacterium]|nr:BamA/TamA family outer membrane protein [Deltaproteobacteria bacterium]